MTAFIVRNRSSKISPGGIISLPLSARKTLGMAPKVGARVTVAVEDDAVILRPTSDQAGARVSPKGQMELVGSARRILEGAEARHYWLELHDAEQLVVLRPYVAA